jgi:hypothetical protein
MLPDNFQLKPDREEWGREELGLTGMERLQQMSLIDSLIRNREQFPQPVRGRERCC